MLLPLYKIQFSVSNFYQTVLEQLNEEEQENPQMSLNFRELVSSLPQTTRIRGFTKKVQTLFGRVRLAQFVL